MDDEGRSDSVGTPAWYAYVTGVVITARLMTQPKPCAPGMRRSVGCWQFAADLRPTGVRAAPDAARSLSAGATTGPVGGRRGVGYVSLTRSMIMRRVLISKRWAVLASPMVMRGSAGVVLPRSAPPMPH